MWEKEIINNIKAKISSKTFISQVTKEMYEFLFFGKEKEFDNFYFFIFSFKNKREAQDILSFFLDFIKDSFYIEVENYYVLFYNIKIDIEIDKLILSLSEDFSINIRVFSSGNVSFKNRRNFFQIFKVYIQYLDKENIYYCSNKELIMELYNQDKALLKQIKPIIISKILTDHQLETLVYSFVKNDLNITKTAKDMYMHRNTINNKLDLIQRETQLNIRHFNDAMALLLLLSL
ncbi:MAG: helix-turn-helix domain-containing protein [Bacilli bacterium]|nr:helix-turn-helix domain-containing protein [Bacilli bacterium]